MVAVDPEKIHTVWLGQNVTSNINYNIHITEEITFDKAVTIIKEDLQDSGVIFRI